MNRRVTNWRKAARKGTAMFLAFGLSACGNVESTKPVASDTYDPELGVDTAALTPIGGTCAYVSTTGVMTVTLAASDVALFSRRSDGVITINDAVCTNTAVIYANAADVTAAHAGTGTLLKKIAIASTAGTTAEDVIIDYINGTFALGSAATITTQGITIDLKDNGVTGDQVSLRGTTTTTTVDSIQSGVNGINYTAAAVTANVAAAPDALLDISVANVELERFALLDGADVFTGAGGTQAGAAVPSTIAITVFAGPGNDSLRGGLGADTLNGGGGNDVFTMAAAADGNDVFNGGTEVDTVSYGGAPTVTPATNIPTANGASGMRTAVITAALNGMAGSGDLVASESDTIATDVEILMGGSGNDTLTGGANADTIYGGAGNDLIQGKAGADTMFGEAGADTFDMQATLAAANAASPAASDILNGGADIDVADFHSRSAAVSVTNDGVAADDGEAMETANVKADVETVLGGSGGNTLSAGTNTASVTLTGGAGADTITGGAGNDVITGAAGDDVLSGGAGDDSFLEGMAANGNDTFAGGAGKDTVDYSGRSATITVVIDGTTSNGDLTATEADIENTDIESLIGGSVADTFSAAANTNNEQFVGGAGDDHLTSSGGNDVIEGDAGTDVIDCGAGDGDICLDTADCASATNCEL